MCINLPLNIVKPNINNVLYRRNYFASCLVCALHQIHNRQAQGPRMPGISASHSEIKGIDMAVSLSMQIHALKKSDLMMFDGFRSMSISIVQSWSWLDWKVFLGSTKPLQEAQIFWGDHETHSWYLGYPLINSELAAMEHEPFMGDLLIQIVIFHSIPLCLFTRG